MSFLGLAESADNDPCKFVLLCRGSSERFTLQAANVDIKQIWVRHIQEVLDAQSNFLSGEKRHTVPQSDESVKYMMFKSSSILNLHNVKETVWYINFDTYFASICHFHFHIIFYKIEPVVLHVLALKPLKSDIFFGNIIKKA